MAGRKVFRGGSAIGHGNGNASTLSILLHRPNAPSSSPDALFLPGSSSSFHGSRSLVSFADARGTKGGSDTDRSFFRPFVHYGEIGEDDIEEYIYQPEKKRRLTADQLHFLEKSFESENSLEPDRKIQLAKDLGLQPRQVAIWFQNRRARWKTKQLEKDYESLETSYNNLRANYENLLKENDKLKEEVASLTEKVNQREETEAKKLLEPPQKCLFDSASDGAREQEGKISIARSDMCDSQSPHYQDRVHSSLLEHCDSSYAFEPDQSDLSQEEEENLSKSPFPPYLFPKLEHVDDVYSDPPESACHFEFGEEDHALWSWSY